VNPPRLATWLLLTFGTGPDVSVIAGDLREQYPDRSRSWYWRQVSYAIAVGAMQHLQRHWIRALCAIWIGGATMGIASVVFRNVAYWLLPAMLPAPISPSSLPVLLWTIALPATVAGWVVGRLNRPQSVPFGMALAMVVLLLEVLPRLVFLASNSFQHERFLPYLWAYVARVPLLAALLLTGILLGTVIGQSAGSQFHKGTSH
jgi:hypothetical protein